MSYHYMCGYVGVRVCVSYVCMRVGRLVGWYVGREASRHVGMLACRDLGNQVLYLGLF